jgi:hypothetical protein
MLTTRPIHRVKRRPLRGGELRILLQQEQLGNPNATITTQTVKLATRLGNVAASYAGVCTGDYPRFGRSFWEVGLPRLGWELQQTTSKSNDGLFGGCSQILLWEQDRGSLRAFVEERLGAANAGSWLRGYRAWNHTGVAVKLMQNLPVKVYLGNLFDDNVAVIIPDKEEYLLPMVTYCSSDEFAPDVRKLNQKVAVKTQYLLNVPFDLAHWQKVAAEKYPNGLPEPYSDDPTQWLFHGHPARAETGAELHVALARLCGCRWPAETDPTMRLFEEARDWVAKARVLPAGDDSGLLTLPAVAGQRPLVERLRGYLAAAFGDAWSDTLERRLVAEADEVLDKRAARDGSLEAWLRDRAFRQHCALFHHRPFLWHIWDGQTDGFAAFLHYHRLPKAALEKLTYSLLGDWIARMRDAADDRRLEAALILREKLAAILKGESPLDVFVRWKPLAAQPIGWNPDLDDGVRLNIRPFVRAGVLRDTPNIHWRKDRGKDVASAPWYAKFNGERINDHTLTLAEKEAAREAVGSRVA